MYTIKVRFEREPWPGREASERTLSDEYVYRVTEEQYGQIEVGGTVVVDSPISGHTEVRVTDKGRVADRSKFSPQLKSILSVNSKVVMPPMSVREQLLLLVA